MINIFYGFKLNQQRVFDSQGENLLVTRIKALPLLVKKVSPKEEEGYLNLQVEVRKSLGRKRKKLILRQVKLLQAGEIKAGAEIKAGEVFKPGDLVQVTGVTKGRGFSGVMKRWNFAGGPRTHGQSDRQRAPGSIGQRTDPGRVWKGKKMPGHMGTKTKTIKGLKVFKFNQEENELWLTGLVPGGKGGLIKIVKL